MPAKYPSTKYSPSSILPSPYPVRLLEQTPWNSFFKSNGYGELSQKLNLQIVSDIHKAEELWKLFSPNKSVFDLWDVRKAWYEGYKYQPYFITIIRNSKRNDDLLGMLPLWFNPEKTLEDACGNTDFQHYVWFGSNWPEDNRFFVKDNEVIPLLLLAAPKPLELACISPRQEYKFLEKFDGFTFEEDKKYFLDLSKMHTLDDYLLRLKKKKRYNLKRDRKHILSRNPKVVIGTKNIEEMFSLSIKRFRLKYANDPSEYSAFEDDRRKNVFRSLISNAGKYEVRMITTIINDNIEAVEFGLVYNKSYYALNAGVDISGYPGLGVFSNLLVIEDAIKLGCEKIDFLESDNNWKDSWQFDSFYQYQFTK